MADLTIDDYAGFSEEELSRFLQEERRKMFGSDAPSDIFEQGPVTLYRHRDHNPEE